MTQQKINGNQLGATNKIGILPTSTFSSTGNKVITGIGFKPTLVKFTNLISLAGAGESGSGAMQSDGTQFAVGGSAWGGAGANQNTMSSKSYCIIRQKWQTSTTPFMRAKFISMDDDGFTINVDIANNEIEVAYEAFA